MRLQTVKCEKENKTILIISELCCSGSRVTQDQPCCLFLLWYSNETLHVYSNHCSGQKANNGARSHIRMRHMVCVCVCALDMIGLLI